MKHDRLTAAAAELSRTMNEHAPATRRPEDVLADMVDQVTQSGRAAAGLPAYATLTDRRPDDESAGRLSMGLEPLTPPPGVK